MFSKTINLKVVVPHRKHSIRVKIDPSSSELCKLLRDKVIKYQSKHNEPSCIDDSHQFYFQRSDVVLDETLPIVVFHFKRDDKLFLQKKNPALLLQPPHAASTPAFPSPQDRPPASGMPPSISYSDVPSTHAGGLSHRSVSTDPIASPGFPHSVSSDSEASFSTAFDSMRRPSMTSLSPSSSDHPHHPRSPLVSASGAFSTSQPFLSPFPQFSRGSSPSLPSASRCYPCSAVIRVIVPDENAQSAIADRPNASMEFTAAVSIPPELNLWKERRILEEINAQIEADTRHVQAMERYLQNLRPSSSSSSSSSHLPPSSHSNSPSHRPPPPASPYNTTSHPQSTSSPLASVDSPFQRSFSSLLAMGFNQPDILQSLDISGGDYERALERLLQLHN